MDELADYYDNPVSARRKRTRRLAAWGALAAAACVSGFIFVGQFRTVHDGEVRRAYDPPLPQQQHVSSSVTIRWTPFPTLWEYYRAAQRSPDDLEAFLGEHADRMPPAAPEPFRIGMFSVPEEETL